MRRASCLLLTLFVALPVFAQEHDSPAECAPTDTVDETRLLRQLSLDLLGRPPTIAEYEALEGDGAIDVASIVGTDEHLAQVRRYHRALLWGNLTEVTALAPGQRRISRIRSTGIWRVGNARRTYRGDRDLSCLDQLQTEFRGGRPVPIRTFTEGCESDRCVQEGYVMVEPYWAPGTRIKVCAFDAQADTGDGTDGRSCSAYNADENCGCGPNLRACAQVNGDHELRMREALADEPARLFEHVVAERRSYLEAFTTQETLVNGASAHFYRWMTGVESENSGGGVAYRTEMETMPAMDFTSDEWRVVERGEAHAGVLTSFGYLMRFASNRGRANRFYSAFRCEPFEPPAGGLPEELDDDPPPNLRERAGCAGCHDTLERVSAAWGRWRGASTYGFFTSDFMSMDEVRNDCARCQTDGGDRCSAICNTYFVTADNSHPLALDDWRGMPLARAWLTDEEAPILEQGPAGLVDEPHEQQKVTMCAVRNLATHLLGRELTEDEMLGWVPEMHEVFEDSGYDFLSLTEALVSDSRYRTTR